MRARVTVRRSELVAPGRTPDSAAQYLELPNGKFWRVGTDVGLTALGFSDIALVGTLSYQRYFAGAGMSQELRLGFTIWFV